MSLLVEALHIIGWCLLAFGVGAGLGWFFGRRFLPAFAFFWLFVGLVALAHYTGIITVVVNWAVIYGYFQRLYEMILAGVTREGLWWFVRKIIYGIVGVIGFVVGFLRARGKVVYPA